MSNAITIRRVSFNHLSCIWEPHFVSKKCLNKIIVRSVHYHGFNKTTVRNHYPLPLIPELFDHLQTACVFSNIDLGGAYNLVHIGPGEEWKMVFRMRHGHFGLTNALTVFQHMINDIFRSI